MRYQLTYLNGTNEGLTVEFNQETITLGRDPGNDMVINEPHVSGYHAKLENRDGQIFIEDQGSTNGSAVNGKQITSPVALNKGDSIQLGIETKLAFTPLPEKFSERTVISKPGSPPVYPDGQHPQQYKVKPKEKSFPTWIIFVALAIIFLCVGVVLVGGGSLIALNLFSNSESQTQQALSAVQMQTDEAILFNTQIAMTEAPIATATAQAEQAMTQHAQETSAAQVAATEAAISYYWNLILDAMGTNPLYGPTSGSLTHYDDGNVEASVADVNYANAVITADFYPPFKSDETLWDAGFFFRDQGSNSELRLSVDSSGEFYLLNRVGEEENYIFERSVENLNLEMNSPNTFILLVWDNRCIFFLNNQFIAEVDISVRTASGDIAAVTNIDSGKLMEGATTNFENFTIYALPIQ